MSALPAQADAEADARLRAMGFPPKSRWDRGYAMGYSAAFGAGAHWARGQAADEIAAEAQLAEDEDLGREWANGLRRAEDIVRATSYEFQRPNQPTQKERTTMTAYTVTEMYDDLPTTETIDDVSEVEVTNGILYLHGDDKSGPRAVYAAGSWAAVTRKGTV